MEKGTKVKHTKTGRVGAVHSHSKKHPGWIKVIWDGDTTPYRYEVAELVSVKCGREHSQFPGYFCIKLLNHDGECGCA